MSETLINQVKLSLGHIVESYEKMTGYCGANGYGWEYGTINDSTCSECKEIYTQLK